MADDGESEMDRDPVDEQLEEEWAQAEGEDIAAEEAAEVAKAVRRASEEADKAMRCPSCWKMAETRHCLGCKWLVCRDCSVTWDPHTGRFTTSGRDMSASFQVGDTRDDGTLGPNPTEEEQ